MQRLVGRVMPVLLMLTAASTAQADTFAPITGPSPFAEKCSGTPQPGTLYRDAEVQASAQANPSNASHLVAVWEQDRWSSGGAQGVLTAVTPDAGQTWTPSARQPPFSRCVGGTAANGGDYERAELPTVGFGPRGIVHQAALATNGSDPTTAVLVSRSTDGGRTWPRVAALQRDATAEHFNDAPSITADPTDERYVTAVWSRLQVGDPADPETSFSGDTQFARSTDAGRTWEPARTILDFPENSNKLTFGPQIVVLSDGTLVNVFTMLDEGVVVAAQRSTDKGATWSKPIVVDQMMPSALFAGGVVDPSDGTPVRAADVLTDVAVDPRTGTRTLHVVWQDIRFTADDQPRDQIVISSSQDGGLSWSPARRVSENADVQAFSGSVEVASDGTVGVAYYDFTADNPAGGTLDTDYWLTASHDRGTSFSPRRRLTRSSFDLRTAPFFRGLFLGYHQGLTRVDRTFESVFVTTTGDPANPTDAFGALTTPSLYQSLIHASQPPGPRVSAAPNRARAPRAFLRR